jgi:hypothetical protein
LFDGAVEAGKHGHLGKYTTNSVLDGASLGLKPLIERTIAGDSKGLGDVAGGMIVVVVGGKASQNPYSLLKNPTGPKNAPVATTDGLSPGFVEISPGVWMGTIEVEIPAPLAGRPLKFPTWVRPPLSLKPLPPFPGPDGFPPFSRN